MLAKISSENVAALEAKDASEFDAKLSKFIADANQAKTFMAENQTSMADLQASIKALEGKIVTEARIKEICGSASTEAVSTWAASAEGKKIIGGEASRITMEALANVGTTPAKPAPAGAPAVAADKKTFAQIVQASMSTGKTKSEAIMAAVESNPEEYKAYLATGGTL